MAEHGVLVAVGPDGVGEGALGLVAAEARRRGTGVELLHVVHAVVPVPSGPDQLEVVDRALTKVGREVLTDTADRLRPLLADEVPLTTAILTGPVVATLLERAAEAELVVMERRDANGLERLLTMSISTRVGAHAHVPVVVVPHGWAGAGPDAVVTVGVDRPREARHQVETALGYAGAAGRPLVLLHAVWLAEPYQDMVFLDYGRSEWVRDARAEIDASLAELDRGGVAVTEDIRWQRPVEALVEASRESALLVLNRRDRASHPLRASLGGITRTLLRHAACPVMLVDRT